MSTLNRVHLQTFLKTTFCKNIEKQVDSPAIEAPPQKNAIAGLYSVRAILVAKEIDFCGILTDARSSCSLKIVLLPVYRVSASIVNLY